MSARKRVAITGMGVICSLGNTPEDLHSRLCEQQAGYGWTQEYVSDGLFPYLGGSLASFKGEDYLKGRALRPLDRTGRLVTATAKLTLADSGWMSEWLEKYEVGLVLGTMFSSMHTITQFDRQAITAGPSAASPMDFANTVINSGAGQSAIWHKLRGINSTIATGATSGVMAVGYATDLIRQGVQTATLAGGVDEFCFESALACQRAGMLRESPDREFCPVPFAALRNGFALTEASALLMLEEWNSAVARGARILGEISGHGSAYQADSTLSHTEPASIVRSILMALDDAETTAGEIGMISAAARGSTISDQNEAIAIETVFLRDNPAVPVTAIKSMLGETLGSAGAVQVVAMVESLNSGRLPGIRGLAQIDPRCARMSISRETRSLRASSGLISSVGFDGHACSLVVTRYDTEA